MSRHLKYKTFKQAKRATRHFFCQHRVSLTTVISSLKDIKATCLRPVSRSKDRLGHTTFKSLQRFGFKS